MARVKSHMKKRSYSFLLNLQSIMKLSVILKIFDNMVRTVITYMSGPLGRKLRYLYWRGKFKKCGKNVIIDEGVIIQGAEWISVGDNVWIDKYCILLAGKVDVEGHPIKIRENKNFHFEPGELIIGSGVHIGAFNIIQAHGGVYIGNNVTTSAGVKIYSLSNMHVNYENPEIVMYANCMVEEQDKVGYIISPIVIEDGVWISLNSVVLGGTIGKNSFVAPNSVVIHEFEENSYISGNPAKKIKDRFKQHSIG